MLERVYARSEAVVAGVGAGDMHRPTPCSDWDVEQLLGHYVNVVAQFPALIAGNEPDWQEHPDLSDPSGALRSAVAANLAAWRQPGAVEQPSTLMPGMRTFDFNLADAVVHTWDLARALGTDPALPADAVVAVHEVWSQAPLVTARQYGAFGPEVEVPASAPTLDRLLGLFGRTP